MNKITISGESAGQAFTRLKNKWLVLPNTDVQRGWMKRDLEAFLHRFDLADLQFQMTFTTTTPEVVQIRPLRMIDYYALKGLEIEGIDLEEPNGIVKELKEKLVAVIDACEDKNGQFRAWHQHLRETTKAGKELIEKLG